MCKTSGALINVFLKWRQLDRLQSKLPDADTQRADCDDGSIYKLQLTREDGLVPKISLSCSQLLHEYQGVRPPSVLGAHNGVGGDGWGGPLNCGWGVIVLARHNS